LQDLLIDHGVVIALVCAGLAVVYGALTSRALLALSPGNETMQSLSLAVQEGAYYLGKARFFVAKFIDADLRTLAEMLESRQGGRYTVTDLSPSRLVAPFNVMLSITDYDVHEHFEARAVVDCELVRLCAVRATPEERQRIMQHAVDGKAFFHDPVAFRLLDIEFHQSLNDAAENRLLSALAQGLYDIGLDVRRVASAVPGNIEKSVAQHITVAEAVMAKDAAAAVEAYRHHLEHVRDTTIEAMSRARAAS